MKKIFFFWSALVIFLLIFEAKIAQAGVSVHFDFQEGRVSEAYVKFTYEFGSQFGLRVKQYPYPFRGGYTVQILEEIGLIRYQDKMEEELVIVVLINEEKIPFVWIKVKDLGTEEKIKKKGKEFSDKVFKKLKEFERLKQLEKKKGISWLLDINREPAIYRGKYLLVGDSTKRR